MAYNKWNTLELVEGYESKLLLDQKCAVNENPSVCIESAGSKTCDNLPLKN